KTYSNAIELLTAYSGKDAKQYEEHFTYSQKTKIIDVEIFAFGNENTTAKYTDEPLPYREVNNILKITTADGFEAISGVDIYDVTGFSDNHLLELKSISADLKALETLDPVEVMAILREKHPNLSNEARASVDIALWDLAARKAGLPLHKMLGSKRSSIMPYASLRYYDTLPEYIAAVEKYAKLGYTIFKFHVWGKFEKDVKLVELVEQKFADTPYKFLIDFESTYTLEEALELGKMTNDNLFIAYEALIDDTLLEQSAILTKELGMTIIPAGYNVYSPEYIREGIEKKAWDAGRFDITVVGGLSEALKLMIIAIDGDLPIDVQSWGYTLAQAGNLHLMLANERSEYLEASMPKAAFEFGMKNGDMLKQGMIVAPEGAGLGIEVDWELIKTADFYRSSK
ncbi:MAG: enolase C-terminal domain-like protein, partial [Emcibacteraceae bacterium]|nr:enolase C-terminal domain-like protein [Emcibacteraceae bacterium]